MRTLLLAAALLPAATLFGLATAASGSAQTAPADTVTIRPGDPTLVTDWLVPGVHTTTLKVVQPVQQDVGTSTDAYTVADGEVVKVSTVSVPMQGMNQTNTVAAEAGTLSPRRHTSTGGPAEVSLEFMDEGVVGMVTPKTGDPTTVMVETDGPVFDGAWTGEIVRSLPFAEGYVAKVPMYTPEMGDKTFDVVLSVTGQETVGDRTGWAVDAEMGPVTMTFVVDAETRDLLVTRMSPQPGVVLEMVPSE